MVNRAKREAPRAGVTLLVARAESPLGPFWPTRDFGPGGIFVETREFWDEQATHSLVIRDGPRALRVDARVLRQDDNGVAFRFVNLKAAQLHQADQLIGHLFVHGAEVDEKRRAPRLTVETTARWEFNDQVHAAFLEDLSTTGANITSGARPPPGTTVSVYVGVAEAAPLKIDHVWVRGAQAIVARHTAEGFAVTFVSPSKDFTESVRSIRLAARNAAKQKP